MLSGKEMFLRLNVLGIIFLTMTSFNNDNSILFNERIIIAITRVCFILEGPCIL
jgi:hypothetical protein